MVKQGLPTSMFKDSPIEAHYLADGNVAPIIFWPANQIDRKLRPGLWMFDHPCDRSYE